MFAETVTMYRAACGDTIIRPGVGRKYLGRVVVGWRGDKRCENPSMRVDQDPPERCRLCRHLRKDYLNFFDEERREFFTVPAWSCHSYRRVDGEQTGAERRSG